MARYIDADALYKETEKKIKANNECRMAVVDREFLDLINDAFTEDVVPKSEVNDLRRYIILNEDIAIKCKQENGEQNEEYWKGKISAFKQIRAYIDAELKKKYTEGEKEK